MSKAKVATATISNDAKTEAVVDRLSPEWSDYVLSHLADHERDKDGNPRVHGLRRLVQKLIGTIIESGPVDLKFLPVNGGYAASCTWRVSIQEQRTGFELIYGDAADSFEENTDDFVAIFPTAMAATRAEARTLRKALGLVGVGAEELTQKNQRPTVSASASAGSRQPTTANAGGSITDTQIRGVDKHCRDLGIDVLKYINSGGSSYNKIEEIPYENARACLNQLNRYFQDRSLIPESIKGYNPNWRTS